MKNAGFRWVKQWFAWNDIEGAGKGQYDWSIPDRIVSQAEEHGLNLLVRVDREPDWAGPPPQNTDAFREFLSAMATRYKGRIDAIQIWNEPNLAREWGNKPPNPAEYARTAARLLRPIKADRSQHDRHHGRHGAHRNLLRRCHARRPVLPRHVRGHGRQLDRLLRHAGCPWRGLCGPARGLPRRDRCQRGRLLAASASSPSAASRTSARSWWRTAMPTSTWLVLEFGWTTDNRPESPTTTGTARAPASTPTSRATTWDGPMSTLRPTGSPGSG